MAMQNCVPKRDSVRIPVGKVDTPFQWVAARVAPSPVYRKSFGLGIQPAAGGHGKRYLRLKMTCP